MGKLLHQYYIDRTASRYVFKNGKIAVFEGGVYRTDSTVEIEEFKAEINGGIGSIWQIPGQETVDSEDVDPVAVMKRKIIAEYEESKRRSLNNGESFSDQRSNVGIPTLKPAGSTIAGTVASVSNTVGNAKAVAPGSIRLNK